MQNSASRSIIEQESVDRHLKKRKSRTLPVADCVWPVLFDFGFDWAFLSGYVCVFICTAVEW